MQIYFLPILSLSGQSGQYFSQGINNKIILYIFAKHNTIKGLQSSTLYLPINMVERLKVSVEKKFGKKITCQKDCKSLSNNILEISREYLSPATLRRFFGILITNSHPSRITYDILCRYIGIENWGQFIEMNREVGENQNQITEIWSRISEKSKKISTNTIDVIKRKSGINYNKTIERHYADERLSYFLKSEFSSTAFIGPGGYGKSTLLAKWYEKNYSKKSYLNDLILFIQATTLNSFANSELYLEDWLMRQLGLSPDNNFLSILKSGESPHEGRFILIIDGLDESNLQGSKLEKVYAALADLSLSYSSTNWFKIIISARHYTWNKFKPFIENAEKWLHVTPVSFTSDGANMPLLTSVEIQKILDNTINTSHARRTLIDEFSLELKETLSYPYFLQLFVNIFHPENEYLLNDQLEIFNEFLNNQIYTSSFAEEKIDIINTILKLSDYGLNLEAVKKNSLKEIYPIHLKLAGKYLAAYEDLISFGIISEDDIENKFGGFSKIIKFANNNLFEILISKNYIDKEDDIPFSLFVEIERKYSGHELLPHLIIRLYQFAYKNRLLKPLMSFFDLNISTLKSVLSNPQIAITLRKDEYLRKHLLPIYASIPVARKYFFEDFPDFNNITGSFSVSLEYFLKHYDTEDEEIVGFILNVYSGFLSLDEGKIERYFSQIIDFKPNNNFNANIAGKWFACKLMYYYLLKNLNADKVIDETIAYLKQIRKSKNYKYGSFESSFYNALIITNQYDALSKLTKIDEALEDNNIGIFNNELKLFRYICRLNSGKQLELKDIIEIDLIVSQLNPMDSFIFKITGQVLKAIYYLNSNEMTNAYESFRHSTELSNLAGYKIIEVKLMKNLSESLLRLGEKTKSNECSTFAKQLISKTGFSYDLF